MAKKKKRRLRVDRVIFAGIIIFILLFVIYKGISFASSKIYSLFQNSELVESEIVRESPIATVIIDPGHGGIDAGTINNEIYEKDIALKTALLVKKELENQNVKVILTRTTDTSLSDNKINDLRLRAQFTQKYNADYFVSIHVNDYENSADITGFEIYKKDENSQGLAESIGKEIEKLDYSENRGILDGHILQVLNENVAPAVLIELGYIRGVDFEYLTNDKKIASLAKAISQGITKEVK